MSGRKAWLSSRGGDLLDQARRLMPVEVSESKLLEAGLRELVEKLRKGRT